MKSFVFRCRFHWSLFLRVQLTIAQQWVDIIYCLGPNRRPSVAIHWWDMQELTRIAFNKKSDWRLAFWNVTVMSQWAGWHLKSPASRLLALTLVQAQIEDNMKAPRHWLLWGKFIPNKGPLMRKMFQFDDVIVNKLTHKNVHRLANIYAIRKLSVKIHYVIIKINLYNIGFLQVQCGADIARSIFPKMVTNRQPYGVSFVISNSDWYSTWITADMCAISWYIKPCFSGTRLYFCISLIYIFVVINLSAAIFPWQFAPYKCLFLICDTSRVYKYRNVSDKNILLSFHKRYYLSLRRIVYWVREKNYKQLRHRALKSICLFHRVFNQKYLKASRNTYREQNTMFL